MYRVEFRLLMPGCASWNGKWSGEGRNYSIVRELPNDKVTKLFDITPESFDLTKCRSSWTHCWSDGWMAEVTARVVPVTEDKALEDPDDAVWVKAFGSKADAVHYARACGNGNVDQHVLRVTEQVLVVATENEL